MVYYWRFDVTDTQEERIMPTATRREVPHAGSELETLDALLQYCQETLLVKIDRLSDDDLRRPQVPSGTTLLGMVKHVAYGHRWWFRIVFANEPLEAPWTDDDPAADWRLTPEDTRESVIAFYQAEMTRAHEIALGTTPDTRSQRPGTDFSLRWILAYMIQETSRHNGQADILCELIDGRTGR
jgi:uncharacterized damage-inducible protein DinB